MKSQHLRELHGLFKHEGDAVALLYLAHGVAAAGGRALRFREMAREVNKSDEYVPESTLLRCVHRLENSGLISVDRADSRHPLYCPSATGQQKAEFLTFILEALDHWGEDPPANGAT